MIAFIYAAASYVGEASFRELLSQIFFIILRLIPTTA